MKLLKRILLFTGHILQFILWHLPITMVALVGLFFAFRLFINPITGSMHITNYAFAIVAALSSISFAYSRSIEKKDLKQRIQYCGERFLHSAILFLVASIIKYFLLQEQIISIYNDFKFYSVVLIIIGVFPGFLFLASLVNTIAALRELNSVLYERKKPGEELIKFL